MGKLWFNQSSIPYLICSGNLCFMENLIHKSTKGKKNDFDADSR
jgi:hypothetical protein